jgi:hypothetical protein
MSRHGLRSPNSWGGQTNNYRNPNQDKKEEANNTMKQKGI